METFDQLSRTILPILQACAAIVAVVLSISQLTAKSRHMKSAAFWRDELKVTGNPNYVRLARTQHLKASAKVYAEATTPSLKLVGLYAVLTIVFLLLFIFAVAFKQVIANPETLSEFMKIGVFPLGLVFVSIGIIKMIQDMHFRKSNTLCAITQSAALLPDNKLVPLQGFAYLGCVSYAMGLAALSFSFALTSPFPLNTKVEASTVANWAYIIGLAFMVFGMLVAAKRKSKIQKATSTRRMAEQPQIPWLVHSLKPRTTFGFKSRFQNKSPDTRTHPTEAITLASDANVE